MKINQDLIDKLKYIAHQDCVYDSFEDGDMINDYAGGNIDDAFDLGTDAGRIELAREVLDALGIEWADHE